MRFLNSTGYQKFLALSIGFLSVVYTGRGQAQNIRCSGALGAHAHNADASDMDYNRYIATKSGFLKYKDNADWPHRLASLEDRPVATYYPVVKTQEPSFRSENKLAQIFLGKTDLVYKDDYRSKTVYSESQLRSMRLEFKDELEIAVGKGLIGPEQLVQFADMLYFKLYLPTVHDWNWHSYRAKHWDGLPEIAYIREFYFSAHLDALSLVELAAKSVRPGLDFRTLENRALNLLDRIGSPFALPNFGSGIPSWVKTTKIHEARRIAAAVLFEQAQKSLEKQLMNLSLKDLKMLLGEYSYRIGVLENRSTFWMENIDARGRAALTGLLFDNLGSPKLGFQKVAAVLKLSDSLNSMIYADDPLFLLYFRAMRSQVARLLAQE